MPPRNRRRNPATQTLLTQMARQSPGHANESSAIIQLWMLRLLLPLGGIREFVQSGYIRDDALAMALGLEQWLESNLEGEFSPRQVIAELQDMHAQAEAAASDAQLPPTLQANLGRIRELAGLSEVECQLLGFAIMMHVEINLASAADYLGSLSMVKVMHVLSVVLGLPMTDIREALKPDSVLLRSGLVSMERSFRSNQLTGRLNVVSSGFAETVYMVEADPIQMLRDIISPVQASALGLQDYTHMQAQLKVLVPYIGEVLASRQCGVNILLYGMPGTGKTQLTRVLAGLHACDLYEVSGQDAEGAAVEDYKRLSAFRAGQMLLSNRQAMLVFDEAEDIFSGGRGLFGQEGIAQRRKAWMNRTLEENPIPTFWLTNSIHGIDPAFLRRFDMAIELVMPGRQQREAMIHKQCVGLVGDKAISRLAASEVLAPAVVERAAKVIRTVQASLGADEVEPSLEVVINGILATQGHRPVPLSCHNALGEAYDPAFIQADADMEEVARGLAGVTSGRICLYGPPGTGKTAYAHWLAQCLGKPLLQKRASDLLSMYVGGTEHNIARAFQEATTEEAVLLIDEVDSFLQDRRGARRSWEVSAVNEMLTQMESFGGIFIASTNLVQGIDQAALRRFDLKVGFGYLQAAQSCALTLVYCRQLGLLDGKRPLDDILSCRLARLDNLAPGDFATIARQARFRKPASASAFVAALENECKMKESPAGKGMGFLAP